MIQKRLFYLLILIVSAISLSADIDIPIDNRIYNDLPLFIKSGENYGFDPWLRPCSKKNITILLEKAVSDSTSPWRFLAEEYLKLFKPLASFTFSKNSDTFTVYPQVILSAAVQDSHFNTLGIVTAVPGSDTGNIRLDSTGSNKEFRSLIHTGLAAEGSVGRLSLYFKGGINTHYASLESWKKTNDPQRGIMLSNIFEKQDVPGHLWGDEDFIGYANIHTSVADFKLGRDIVKWGRSDKLNLMLSGNAVPFIHMRATKNIGPVDFQFVTGRITADSHDDVRYMYAKHISWRPGKGITLGFNDQVITINRTLDPYYFIPVLPFYFAEHFTGDLDNRLMGFDAAYDGSYFSFYTEFLMDDMRNLAGVFNDSDVSNKWSILAGIRMNKSPCPKYLSTAVLEYSQVEPWVYTSSARAHYDTIWYMDTVTNNARFYKKEIFNYPVHYGRLLGNPLGPNSRSLLFKASGRPNVNISYSLGAEMVWKGSGSGSAVTDMNPMIPDSTAESGSSYRFQDKSKIRFSNLALQRTIISAESSIRLARWNEISLKFIYMRENALNPGDYVQVMIKNSINF
ncbi:MAG: hypothetical protein JNL74_15365 [Fibrobacteres bacterium]|nr:hypothetical protein [Fibrobacterota bacterium]